MTTSPTVAAALVSIGPKLLDEATSAADIGRSKSYVAPLRHAAAIKDASFFSGLPPMLLHDDYHVQASKLYGGTDASKIADAAYRQGPFNEIKRHDREIHGALLFDINGSTYPALVYGANPFRGERTMVVHVYNAPLPQLEADLFDSRKHVSALERKWLGDAPAASAQKMRFHMGAVMRESGLGTMPGFLLNGDYHLVRGGLPWLHLRAATNDAEEAILTDALLAALAYCEHTDESGGSHWGPLNDLEAIEAMSGAHLITVFDRCEDPYEWVPRKVTAETAATTASWQPFLDRMKEQETLITEGARPRARTLLCALAASMLDVKELPDGVNRALDEFEMPDIEEASEMARARNNRNTTIHHLTAMVRTSGVVSPTRVGFATFAPNSLEKVAAATFAASDAVLAFRDVDGWVHRSRDESVHDAITWCTRMAGRIKEPQAMLIIDTGHAHCIKTMQLVNSAVNVEVKTMGDAARLIACPWVTVVMHRTANDNQAGWFTLDASLVPRDLLTVTDKVRDTFGAAPARQPKPAASPEALEQLRREVIEKFETVNKSINELKTLRAAAPVQPRAPPVASESHTMLSLRASVLTLERLTGVKRVLENGGR